MRYTPGVWGKDRTFSAAAELSSGICGVAGISDMKRSGGGGRFARLAPRVACPPVRSALLDKPAVARCANGTVPLRLLYAPQDGPVSSGRRATFPPPASPTAWKGRRGVAVRPGAALLEPVKSPPWTRLRTSAIRLANWEITVWGEAIGPTNACSAGVIRSRNNVRSRFFTTTTTSSRWTTFSRRSALQACFSSNSASSVRKVKLLPAICAVNSSVFTRTCRGAAGSGAAALGGARRCGATERGRFASMAIGRVVEGSGATATGAGGMGTGLGNMANGSRSRCDGLGSTRRRPPPATPPAWTADARRPPPVAAAAALRVRPPRATAAGRAMSGASNPARARPPPVPTAAAATRRDAAPPSPRAHRDPPPASSRSSRSRPASSTGSAGFLTALVGLLHRLRRLLDGVLGLLGGVLGLLDRLRGLLGRLHRLLEDLGGRFAGSVVVLKTSAVFFWPGSAGFFPPSLSFCAASVGFFPPSPDFFAGFSGFFPKSPDFLTGSSVSWRWRPPSRATPSCRPRPPAAPAK